MTGLARVSPLLAAKGVSKTYEQSRWWPQQKYSAKALNHVSLAINEGATLGLVGESGSGKSTLARCLALLEEPSAGEIWFEGRSAIGLPKRHARRVRQQIQLIFQDPSTALNPHLKAAEIVAEPLEVQRQGTRRERRDRALQLMNEVGLPAQLANRVPLELSGGQRQRLALARALAVQPRVLILDEALSGLDLPLQAQIANLLAEIKERWMLTYVFISHDLGLVYGLATEIAVLYQGQVVERGSAKQVLWAPEHPHTRALAAASLTLEPRLSGSQAGP